MATQVKLRRGTRTEHNSFTGAEGEATVDTTNDRLVVHDASKVGGHPHVNFSDHIKNTFIAATGVHSAGVYAMTLDTTPAAYATFFEVIMVPDTTNTGAVDVNINSLGAKNIYRHDGNGTLIECAAGDILANIPIRLIYNGTNFIADIPAASRMIINGATGTTNEGDVNITGDFRQNGVILGSSYRYLATRTASNSTTLDFTSLITSDYDAYVFVLQDIRPADDGARFRLRTSSDNGSSFDSGGSAYNGTCFTCAAFGGTETARSLEASGVSLNSDGGIGIGNLAAETYNGEVTLFNPLGTVAVKRIFFDGSWKDAGGNVQFIRGKAYRDSSADIDAVRFLMDTGNITSGKIHMYGIKNS